MQAHASADDSRRRFLYTLVFAQAVILVCYFAVVRYDDELFEAKGDESVTGIYAQFQDVHVMILIGFGFLMAFLKKYGYSSVGLNFLVSAYTIQWYILMGGFVERVFHLAQHGGALQAIHVNLQSLVLADFATGSVLISFGAVLGKVSPMQLLVVSTLETIFYSINENVALELGVSDVGGSMIIHLFGAYFGLAVSWMVSKPGAMSSANNSASYRSNLFAMIGSLFLWCFWPSFNSILAGPTAQQRTVINTVIAISASCTSTFGMSSLLHSMYDPSEEEYEPHAKGKKPSKGFCMVDIQNATLAGGVAVGAVANMAIGPGGALAVGLAAGALSTLGYVRVQPYLEEQLAVHDTCGVHNLHGMPALLAGLLSVLFAALADFPPSGTASTYNYRTREALCEVFVKRCHDDEAGLMEEDRTASAQAGYQALYLVISLASALVGGCITGKVANIVDPKAMSDFTDEAYWEEVETIAQDISTRNGGVNRPVSTNGVHITLPKEMVGVVAGEPVADDANANHIVNMYPYSESSSPRAGMPMRREGSLGDLQAPVLRAV